MTTVDYERFPPQQELEKVKGRAEGNCFKGVCAVSKGPHGVVVLIAADIKTLEIAWDDISGVPLNRDGVQRVAIFSQDTMTPNVEVTGAARLYRAASVWTAGLGLGLPIRLPFVGSVGVGGSFEKMRMYVEVIPREVADVMREPLKHISERCRLENDSIGYETLHDAIVVAENIGTGLLRQIEPENLLFIFGQTIQSLGYAPIEAPLSPPLFGDGNSISGDGDSEQGNGNNKGKPKHRAVVLCKLKHSDELEKYLTGKKKHGGHNTECYEIAWCELQELKKRLGGFSDHIERPNV